ncbi:MAG TPA: TadE/TadG family type IV pilus assembly protein [Candidatus Deferrimicrobiaceae bacterium]
MKRLRRSGGQSLVETAIVLPVLLVLLAGGYWGFRQLSLEGAATSAAQAHLLRTGRLQADISTNLAVSVLPGGEGVTVSARDQSLAQGVPFFSGLAGRTVSAVDVSRRNDAIGACLVLPRHEFRANREAAVDCWGRDSRSGRSVRRVIRTALIAGAFR